MLNSQAKETSMDIKEKLRSEFDIAPTRIDNIVSLIDEGNTIPFIAR